MEKFLESFAKVPLQQKLGGVALIVILIGVGTYTLSLADSLTSIESLDAQIAQQETQRVELEQKAQHRTQFLREVERLKQRLREAEEQLPKQQEIPKVLRDIDYEAKQAGLRVDAHHLHHFALLAVNAARSGQRQGGGDCFHVHFHGSAPWNATT